jgi:hypothetical protein
VDGIDHSEVMLRQATRRNAAAIAAGRVSRTPLATAARRRQTPQPEAGAERGYPS